MKNEEIYKTVEERQKAFAKFCAEFCKGDCQKCPCCGNHLSCALIWLGLEYQEPKQNLPFEIRANGRKPCKSFPVALYSTVEYGNPTSNFIVGLPENYYHDELCKRLNAAALAWHKQMMEKEKGEAK